MVTTVAFRADASLTIGSGHIMRCLTLADALAEQGVRSEFIVREDPGHLINFIQNKGYDVHILPVTTYRHSGNGPLSHVSGPSFSQLEDAEQSLSFLSKIRPDWLIVDHYALDAQWEQRVASGTRRIMVIDDLADRCHECDLLLDQNLGRCPSDYARLVPEHCAQYIGPRYALLRPEFARLREQSLKRRTPYRLERILISMGGVDPTNATVGVLTALTKTQLPGNIEVDVVMGASAPYLEQVRDQTKQLPFRTTVSENVCDIAKRMCDADLSIGASGGTAWERCCLGLPSLIVTLADNQLLSARALAASGAALLLGGVNDIGSNFGTTFAKAKKPDSLRKMSHQASALCHGTGAKEVAEAITLETGQA